MLKRCRAVPDVRPARESDLPRLLKYAAQFRAYHPLLASLPEDLPAIEAALRNMMAGDTMCVLVHDHGVIGGLLSPVWASPDHLVASEAFWWAEQDGKALLEAFENWARDHGAVWIQMLKIEGVRDVAPIYERRGYVPCESAYILRAA